MSSFVSNEHATDNVSYQTTIIIVVSMVITNFGILLRWISRRITHLSLQADDYLIFLAALFVNANSLIYPFSNKYGNGRHIQTLEPNDIMNYLKTIYVSEQFYGTAITLVKVSVLCFYRRIFPTPQFRRNTLVVGGFVVLWLLVNNLLGAFQCTPVRKAWESELRGRCIQYLNFFIGMQVPNIVLDAVILALPVSAIAKLQMSRKKKISVTAIFLLGGLAVIIAIIRLAILITRIGKTDITYSTAIGNWSLIEPAVEVLSACLPTMAPLLNPKQYLTRLRESIRTLLGRSKPSSARSTYSAHPFQQITLSRDAQIQFPPRVEQSSFATNATADHATVGANTDDIPLRSIMVRHDMEWSERQRNAKNVTVDLS